jgi:L-asparagine transporter-like permease
VITSACGPTNGSTMAHDDAATTTGGLKHELRVRHLLALSIGGAIASGFLLFVGQAVAIAGPAVLISYLIGGVILIAVMACLAELCVAKPVGSFATYARDAMGPLAGFLTGWNYWLAWVMGIATESVAAGTYLHAQYSGIPVWLTAFIIIAFEMIINIIGVLLMGNYEMLLTTIKSVGLLCFVVVGILAILGIGFPHHGLSNISSNGGFFPKGGGAVFAALLTVLFAYVGIEMVSVAAEECRDPKRDVPRSLLLSVVAVIGIFLVGTVVLLAILPWNQAGTSSSPFVDALNALNLGPLASIFSWIVIIASVSAVDGGLYTASRMLFSLSREGHFHPSLASTHPTRRTPTLATVLTAGCAFIGALLACLRLRGEPFGVRLPFRLAHDLSFAAAYPCEDGTRSIRATAMENAAVPVHPDLRRCNGPGGARRPVFHRRFWHIHWTSSHSRGRSGRGCRGNLDPAFHRLLPILCAAALHPRRSVAVTRGGAAVES